MGILLEKIDCPRDIKALSIEQLEQLAKEIRQFILDSVSKTGGHLASNLGVVELTLALHYVFDFSRDKLLWDVGHQCYAHKIITGRRGRFARLRKADGPSGFPDPSESEYDQFIVGHAGTAAAGDPADRARQATTRSVSQKLLQICCSGRIGDRNARLLPA